MSLFERFRRRQPARQRPLSLSVTGLGQQEYDPESIAIDRPGVQIAQERLRRGYGAPKIVPYAQTTLPSFGVRQRLLELLPALSNFPNVKRLLES